MDLIRSMPMLFYEFWIEHLNGFKKFNVLGLKKCIINYCNICFLGGISEEKKFHRVLKSFFVDNAVQLQLAIFLHSLHWHAQSSYICMNTTQCLIGT